MLKKLDINDLFEDKYESINLGAGIGGMGLITSKQSIHVYNHEGLDRENKIVYPGIGDHDDVTKEMLKKIYGTDYSSHLYSLISIKYWNSDVFKMIAFYFPKYITLDEYNYLLNLREYYNYILHNYEIIMAAYEFGDNVIEYGSRIKTTSDINPIIEYGRDRIDLELRRNKKEKILSL